MDHTFYPGNSPEDAKKMVKDLEELMKHPEQWVDIREVLRELERDLWQHRIDFDQGGDQGA